MVQPDLSVICDPSIIDSAGCNGTPDLIIEILSDSTAQKDQKDKFELYEQNRVKEYWMIHPLNKMLIVYTLNDQFKLVAFHRPYQIGDKVKVTLFKDFEINLKDVFDDKS